MLKFHKVCSEASESVVGFLTVTLL